MGHSPETSGHGAKRAGAILKCKSGGGILKKRRIDEGLMGRKGRSVDTTQEVLDDQIRED